MKRVGELLRSEHWVKILWVDSGEALIRLFGVDVPSFSQGVGFSTEFPGSEMNDQIELTEVL